MLVRGLSSSSSLFFFFFLLVNFFNTVLPIMVAATFGASAALAPLLQLLQFSLFII
jgi:hypothetical protein